MDWTAPVDAYCERLDASFWSEPINAVTNAAFLVAALIMWMRVQGPGLGIARLLSVILFVIGVGSFLFHTFAQGWAGAADVLPILLFILVYIFAATRDFLEQPVWIAALVTAAFLPVSVVLIPLFQNLPIYGVSAAYMPVPLMIAAYAVILRNRHPETARGLAIGAAILMLSLTFRSLDETLCAQLPHGTHFMWHILNAVMLGWMIEVYRRHVMSAVL